MAIRHVLVCLCMVVFLWFFFGTLFEYDSGFCSRNSISCFGSDCFLLRECTNCCAAVGLGSGSCFDLGIGCSACSGRRRPRLLLHRHPRPQIGCHPGWPKPVVRLFILILSGCWLPPGTCCPAWSCSGHVVLRPFSDLRVEKLWKVAFWKTATCCYSVVFPLSGCSFQKSHLSKPLSISRWFPGFVVVGRVALLDDHHCVSDPGKELPSCLIRPMARLESPSIICLSSVCVANCFWNLGFRLVQVSWASVQSRISAVAKSQSRANPLNSLATFAYVVV